MLLKDQALKAVDNASSSGSSSESSDDVAPAPKPVRKVKVAPPRAAANKSRADLEREDGNK